MDSSPNPSFNEIQWIKYIDKSLEEEHGNDPTEICISNVPKTLMSFYSASYIPQEVAIGPYHFQRPEVYEMERHKLAAARRTHQRLLHGNKTFKGVVHELDKLHPRIQSCYHKYLNFGKTITLAWMMAIDASFLLEFLEIYAIKQDNASTSSSSRWVSHPLVYARTKAAQNAILRDIVMLENQIPLFVLRQMLEAVQYLSLESVDVKLQAMLMGFYEELSPFKTIKDLSEICVTECHSHAHLLDFLYDTIVPKAEQQIEMMTEVEDKGGDKQRKGRFCGDSTQVTGFPSKAWKMVSELNSFGPIKKLLTSKPLTVISNIISNIPGISTLTRGLCFSQNSKKKSPENESSNNDINKPPLVGEITVPSVTELAKSKVQFVGVNGNILTINFDPKKATLQLPIISVDVNTVVVMRNLVAYEASIAFGPMAFTRYTELMNGIIDTEDDAKFLREKGIIQNRLKSDAEVANLWNEISKSITLTKVPFMDKVIDDINKYHNSRWKVKFRRCVRRYLFGSWQCLTLLAIIILVLLTALESVCSVYECHKFYIT